MPSQKSKPLLRWAGSKQKLLPHLLPFIPNSYNTYFEPFFGSGALYFYLKPEKSVIGDLNPDLIRLYEEVAESPEDVHEAFSGIELDRDSYYHIRSNRSEDIYQWSAEFIVLNRLCWNGLYRVNSKGNFNVPYGAPKTKNLPTLSELISISNALSGEFRRIICADFEYVVQNASAGDFVFFDPPYVTSHNMNGFIEYNEKIFSWEDQIRLSRICGELDARGVRFLVANADHAEIRSLYGNFEHHAFSRASTLAGQKQYRKRVTELLIHNSPGLEDDHA